VLGDWDSPIICVLIYNPGKVAAFSREMLKRGIAVVVVGFPATRLFYARTRICISAAHSRQDLEKGLAILKEVASEVGIFYHNSGNLKTGSH
jgi:serine palmitoyltransferase